VAVAPLPGGSRGVVSLGAELSVFTTFLYELRHQGVAVGLGEWRAFLSAMARGVAVSPDALYRIGRALLCRSEADFDAFDIAFAKAFEGARLPEDFREQLEKWLEKATRAEAAEAGEGLDDDELLSELLKRLREQDEEHHGGDRWVGTRGTSPFGRGGNNERGVRIGEDDPDGGGGGGRSAVQLAMERRWENYRTDRTIDVRDFEVALRALRKLVREGRYELDLPGTIRRTCDNAGDIELVEQRERQNQVHVVLLMDAGGSMSPHHEQVSRLFSAAYRTKTFKTFTSYYFHNCVYGWLYRDFQQLDRVRTEEVLRDLTPQHRLLFVGDASMAPYELFNVFAWPGTAGHLTGLDWLRRFRTRCPGSVWLNPDPRRYWDHPTVRAIGQVFEMHPLTVDGLHRAVQKLRAPM